MKLIVSPHETVSPVYLTPRPVPCAFMRPLPSRYPPPIPGTNIPKHKLRAGPSSHPLLHFFIPSALEGDTLPHEVYVQQLAEGRGAWWDESHSRERMSDGFGFRASVDGHAFAVCRVEVETLEPRSRIDSDDRSWVEWVAVRHTVGDGGANAFKIMFNTELFPPGVDGQALVDGVVGAAGGVSFIEPLCAARCRQVTAAFVRERTGVDEKDGLRFCTVSLFLNGLGMWEFHVFCFTVVFDGRLLMEDDVPWAPSRQSVSSLPPRRRRIASDHSLSV
jgi:hypothetical protein